MRLIDAEEVIKAVDKHTFETKDGLCLDDDISIILEDVPTIEERKTGRWKIKTINTFELAYGSTGYEPVYECSECDGVEESYLRLDKPIMPEDASFPRFCPNCGAYMAGRVSK